MGCRLTADAERLGDSEGGELLRWLESGMLTQLGHVTRYRDGRKSDRLGICRNSAQAILADVSFERAFDWFAEEGGRAPRVDTRL